MSYSSGIVPFILILPYTLPLRVLRNGIIMECPYDGKIYASRHKAAIICSCACFRSSLRSVSRLAGSLVYTRDHTTSMTRLSAWLGVAPLPAGLITGVELLLFTSLMCQCPAVYVFRGQSPCSQGNVCHASYAYMQDPYAASGMPG